MLQNGEKYLIVTLEINHRKGVGCYVFTCNKKFMFHYNENKVISKFKKIKIFSNRELVIERNKYYRNLVLRTARFADYLNFSTLILFFGPYSIFKLYIFNMGFYNNQAHFIKIQSKDVYNIALY